MAWKGKLEKIELPLQWPEKWELWLIVRNCIRYYLVLTVYTLFLVCLFVVRNRIKLPGVDCAPWAEAGCVWPGGRETRTWAAGGSLRSPSLQGCRAYHLRVKYLLTRENKMYIYIFSSRIHILWNRRHSPLCWVWPLGVTLSLGSIERGFTASVTGKNISQLLTWRLWMSQSEVTKS